MLRGCCACGSEAGTPRGSRFFVVVVLEFVFESVQGFDHGFVALSCWCASFLGGCAFDADDFGIDGGADGLCFVACQFDVRLGLIGQRDVVLFSHDVHS